MFLAAQPEDNKRDHYLLYYTIAVPVAQVVQQAASNTSVQDELSQGPRDENSQGPRDENSQVPRDELLQI